MGSSFHSTTSDSGTSCARFEQDGHSKGPSIQVRHSLFFLNDFLHLKAQFVPSLKMSSKAHGKYIWKYPSKAFRYDSLVPCRWPSNKTNTTLTTDCNHRITYCSVLLTTVYSNAEWPQSIISFYIILVFFSITFKEMLKHPTSKLCVPWSLSSSSSPILLLCTVYPTGLHYWWTMTCYEVVNSTVYFFIGHGAEDG